MAENFVLPVMTMVQTTAVAEPAIEGEEEAGFAFAIDGAPVDDLLADAAPADMAAVCQPPQDLLQMLIEDLSGISGALRQAAPEGGQAAEEQGPSDPELALPGSGMRIALPAAADAAPGLAVQMTPDMPQADFLSAEPPSPHIAAARDVAVAAPDQPLPPSRVPVASVVRQMAEAVVSAREDRIEIALAPEELGRIRMVMTGPEHGLHVLVWAERPEVLDQLRRNAAFLQECFGDAGMADASFEFQGNDGTGSGGGQSLSDAPGQGLDVTETASVPAAWTPLAIPARLDIRI
ncbi:flagellar hook-length control protein FliK [Paracoccus sp. S3-43]|uniref:flagellar hook-length control protein FliK n=1 Tax=Paracoccus sp. S3-43 TaxID=3030011 RepID=UPI0023AED87C|nr:flagellar hook-length control protein FliK [Paracoccus sp. S3-43]WEF24333.1 flagellar hook-length control protein FliK [Paracoccus sp. S3-43]